MKRYLVTLMMVTLLAGPAAGAEIEKSGIVSADETWSDSVKIVGILSVLNAKVTITPGTVVRFNHNPRAMGLGLRTGGAVWAVGTADQPILFTTTDTVVGQGKWGEIDLYENINVDQTRFEHCIFEGGSQALDFRSTSHSSVQSANAITIENCVFRHCGTGIYITSGGTPTIRHTVFHDINSAGIFAHGAGAVTVEYCTFYNNSAGIINAGEPDWGWEQSMTADHLTIHHIDGDLADTEKWWTGYGIYCAWASNQSGTITLTNSIIANVTFEDNSHTISGGPVGYAIGSWTSTHDYNCYYRGGYRDLVGGDPGPNAVEADPKFVDPDNGDFSLQWDSPCAGAGSDGTNIGVSQVTMGIADGKDLNDMKTDVRVYSGNGQVTFTLPAGFDRLGIYALDGQMIRSFGNGAGNEITWQGESAGVYFYRVRYEGQVRQDMVVLK